MPARKRNGFGIAHDMVRYSRYKCQKKRDASLTDNGGTVRKDCPVQILGFYSPVDAGEKLTEGTQNTIGAVARPTEMS